MTIEQLKKQHEKMADFMAGYEACLEWLAQEMMKEQKPVEAANADAAKA